MAYRDTRNLGRSDGSSRRQWPIEIREIWVKVTAILKRQWPIEIRDIWVEVTAVLEGNGLSTNVLGVSCLADSSPIVSINYTITLIPTYER